MGIGGYWRVSIVLGYPNEAKASKLRLVGEPE